MSAAKYELLGVERSYLKGAAQVRAIHDIDLDIAAGEFVALEGPSGSGKSTLLQLLGALDVPTAGSVAFDGQDLSSAGDSALTTLRAERIGFIFQQFNLIPTLTAVENVAIALSPKMPKAERYVRSMELLTSVGLEARAQHLPSRLSGGEQQRVAIARALANHPEVIIADEPTGNLDSSTAAEVMSLVSQIRHERSVTVIIATHDDDVAKHASRRIKMRDGQIASDSVGEAGVEPATSSV